MESEDSSSEKEKSEQPSSDEESEEEEEVEDELKPEKESSDEEKSSSSRSRGGGSIPSNEKSREGSNRGDEPSSGSDSDDPFKPGPSEPRRSTRERCPVIKYGSAYGDKPAIVIEKDIIRSTKAWEKAVEPKAKAVLK